MVRARGRGLPRKRRTAAIVERVLALALDKRIMLYDVSTSMYVLGCSSKNTRGVAESRLNCCRVSAETARFAGRGSETLGRVVGTPPRNVLFGSYAVLVD